MIPVNLEDYVAQTARLLDIPLSTGGEALVAKQLAILFEHAEAFAAFDLHAETTPLPDFIP
ncbi:MAG: hypothetical protein Q8R02_23905 [Hyphomonadaceae bacterium]|nr:hypothetical protein [Hyphomonadaceae bacterium]